MNVNPYNYNNFSTTLYNQTEDKSQRSRLYCYEILDPENLEITANNIHSNPITHTSATTTNESSDSQENLHVPEENEYSEDSMEIDGDKNNNQQEDISVNVVSMHELQTLLFHPIPNSPFERLNKLKSSLFTHFPPNNENQKEYWNLWLEIPRDEGSIYMNMVLEEDVYESQCLAENIDNTHVSGIHYHYLRVSAENDPGTLYFSIRIDPTFATGEILHIQQVKPLTGTEVKSLCMAMINYIKPAYVYLHDDAKIMLEPDKKADHVQESENEDKPSMALRIFLPVVNDTPKTWYTSDGFTLAEFEQLANFDDQPKKPQNLGKYNSAVHTVRNTLLKDLEHKSFLPNYTQAEIRGWIKKYLVEKGINKNYRNCTVHELAKGIYLASRNKQNKELSQAAEEDFKKFYFYFLQKNETLPQKYQEALTIVETYQLWMKTS